jgi:hypothetical protein
VTPAIAAIVDALNNELIAAGTHPTRSNRLAEFTAGRRSE